MAESTLPPKNGSMNCDPDTGLTLVLAAVDSAHGRPLMGV